MTFFRTTSFTLVCLSSAPALASSLAQQNLFQAMNVLESANQQSRALERVANVPLLAEDTEERRGAALGISHDRLRSQRALDAAIAHLVLNDNQRALELAEQAYQETYESDVAEATGFLKVIYEAQRKLGRLSEAAQSCTRFVSRGSPDSTLLLSCAHTLQRASLRDLEGNVLLSRQTLNAFAYSQSVRGMKNSALQSAILLSSAYENLGLNSEASDYLQRSISIARPSDSWLARATYILALMRLKKGETEHAREGFTALSGSNDTDGLTRVMAKQSLARILAQNGQFDASESLYKEAIDIAENLPTQFNAEVSSIGKVSFSVPDAVSAVFPKREREKLLGEYAASLCARGKFGECESVYRKLPDSVPMQSHGEILLRSGFLRQKSQSRVASILGFSKADLEFVNRQRNTRDTLSLAELEARSQALGVIAKSYGADSANIQRLLEIQNRVENVAKESRGMRLALVASIASAGNSAAYPIDARVAQSNREIAALMSSLYSVFGTVNAESLSHWNSADGGYENALQHQSALLARVKAINDKLSDLEEMPKINALGSKYQSISKNGKEIFALVAENKSRIGASRFLNSFFKSDKSASKIAAIEQESDSSQITSELAMLDLRITSLKRHSEQNLAIRIERLQATLVELSELHARMFRAPQNTAERESLAQVRKAWAKILATIQTLRDSESSIRVQGEKGRAKVIDKVLTLQREIDDNDAEATLLAQSLRQEMQTSLVSAAADIYVPVRDFHDRLRIAIADSDLQAIEETETGRSNLARAAEERNRWMQSLRKTLEWELGR